MLQVFRASANTWVAKVLYCILTLTFVAWGIGDIFTRRLTERPVAVVGKENISLEALDQRFRSDLEKAREYVPQGLSEGDAKRLGLVDQSLQSLIEQSLMDQEISRVGLIVNSDIIGQQLLSMPQLRDKDGHFDAGRLKQMLQQQGLNEDAFFAQQKVRLAREQIVQSVLSGISVPDVLTDHVAAGLNETRDITLVTLRLDAQSVAKTPDDAILKAYVEAHKRDYMSPEKRTVSALWISPVALAKDISIDDASLKSKYDSDPGHFSEPARRSFKQIVFNDEATAKAFAAEVQAMNAPGAFERQAKAEKLGVVSIDKETSADLPEGLGAAVFSLPIDSVSDPLKSPLGWHVVKVTKEEPAVQKSFDEVKAQMRLEMTQAAATDRSLEIANKLDEKIGSGAQLEEAAQSLGLQIVKVDGVTASTDSDSSPEGTSIPLTKQVRQAIFALGEGEVSSLLDLGKDGYLAVRVDTITPSSPEPFAKIQAAVTAAWKQEQKQALAQKQAADLLNKLHQDSKTTLAVLAKAAGLQSTDLKDISRPAPPANIPPQMIEAIFNLKSGEAIQYPSSDSVLVAQVTDVKVPNTKLGETKRLQVSDEIQNQLKDDYVSEFFASLRQVFPVQINHDVVDQYRNRGDDG